MGAKRKRKERCACRAWVDFARRAAYMLVVLFAAAILVANLGGESFSLLGFVKDAASALAEAAGEAFGEKG
mgnify:CR=1 FL=1